VLNKRVGTREVKKRFDAEGIGIPYPQRDGHLYLSDADRKDIVAHLAVDHPWAIGCVQKGHRKLNKALYYSLSSNQDFEKAVL
jgi:hypothetical protein